MIDRGRMPLLRLGGGAECNSNNIFSPQQNKEPRKIVAMTSGIPATDAAGVRLTPINPAGFSPVPDERLAL